MTLGARFTSLATVFVLILCLGPARAGFPPLPGVPGVPSVNQAAKAIVSKELVKQMGDEFNLEQPLRLSADAEYPTSASLPGASFHPVNQHVVAELYAHAHDGHVRFPAGDYAISVFTYCKMAHVHVLTRNKFRLTPIQGKWADIASALFARTSYGYNRAGRSGPHLVAAGRYEVLRTFRQVAAPRRHRPSGFQIAPANELLREAATAVETNLIQCARRSQFRRRTQPDG